MSDSVIKIQSIEEEALVQINQAKANCEQQKKELNSQKEKEWQAISKQSLQEQIATMINKAETEIKQIETQAKQEQQSYLEKLKQIDQTQIEAAKKFILANLT